MSQTEIIIPDVEIATTPLLAVSNPHLLLKLYKVEERSTSTQPIYCGANESCNQLINCLLTAYSNHYPIILTPDIIWITFIQGLSSCIHANPEQMRHLFVDHLGKKEISVDRDEFAPGQNNNWESVYSEIVGKIKESVKVHIGLEFSTTTDLSRSVQQLSIMNALENYYSYVVCSRCGIPKIYIVGTTEDYIAILDNAKRIGIECDLRWWTDKLCTRLEQFVEAKQGNIDISFWKSIFSRDNIVSGKHSHGGWIFDFFPYLKNNVKNHRLCNNYLERNLERDLECDIRLTDVPLSIMVTPFIWKIFGHPNKMVFYSGFDGINQDRTTLAVQPNINWAIGRSTNEESEESEESKKAEDAEDAEDSDERFFKQIQQTIKNMRR